jgi:hypothetical protein
LWKSRDGVSPFSVKRNLIISPGLAGIGDDAQKSQPNGHLLRVTSLREVNDPLAGKLTFDGKGEKLEKWRPCHTRVDSRETDGTAR